MQKTEIAEIDYEQRRRTFLKGIKGAVAVFRSASVSQRNHDVDHPYRQESNFYFLTGLEEPESLCLLSSESSTPFQIFVRPRAKDRLKEFYWEGRVLGPENAKSKLQADAAYPSTPDSYFDDAFVTALKGASELFYRVGLDKEMDARILSLVRKAQRQSGRGRTLWPIRDPEEVLGEMRIIKSRPEIQRLEKAAAITVEAHLHAMNVAKPEAFEYEIEAALYHAFRAQGATRLGYPSIVASGPNACILHYRNSSRRMGDGDLLLVDAAAEFDYYTADVTRTFPVNGTFSDEQRAVYQAVLTAQKACINHIRPGRTLASVHAIAVESLTESLKQLRVLKGPTASLIKNRAYFNFFPHSTSHWLGMDVHDLGTSYQGELTTPRKFKPGMVLTVEPALYFPADFNSTPSRFRGIGIRIEDDVLVTADGCKILTSGIPKEINEVESLCSQG